ncbi:phosphonate ABC transporter, permease protein PhnE [Pollutimonas subterranea]|uniref:Phosphonate ABC transporter, permease protein PhnE n=1 Tax=Pollutimonas subterranea TaxID=2045210 RepID=A0A2N4U5Q3_9BURK|nr:phosphonate ABC transporter, permease protein PhnE [Pollutimonas subterranea]PLC50344.1 phosphonate ABC transporter, permease protein PhnE [Pollutimonas subterranea]
MNTSHTLPNSEARSWVRYTPGQRLLRFVLYLLFVLAIVQSMRTIDVIPEFLYDAPTQMADLVHRMWPVSWQSFQGSIQKALIETLHMATLGTILAVVLAVPVGLLASEKLTPNKAVNFLARLILVSSRSINSLVWALLFIAVFGPGPLAGTIAIAFRSIGFIGKLLGEALDDAHPGPIEALTATGASTGSIIGYGYWPQIRPAFWSIVLLRWDINVRESAVLGLVGAGGIGMALNSAMDLFQWDKVALILLLIFGIVIVAEIIITRVRKTLL